MSATWEPEAAVAPSLRDQLAAVRDALARAPDRADLYVRLGDIERQRQRPAAAAAAYRAALERDPDLPGVHRRLGEQLLVMDHAGEAETYLREAILAEPGDATLHRALAEACELRDHFAEAIAWWRRARSLNAGSARLRRRLAAALLRREHWDEGWRLGRSFITVPGLRREDVSLPTWGGEPPPPGHRPGLLLHHEPAAPLPLTLLGLTLARSAAALGWRVRCTLPEWLIDALDRLHAIPTTLELVPDSLPLAPGLQGDVEAAAALADLPRLLPPPVGAAHPARRPQPEGAGTLLVPGIASTGILARSGCDAPRSLWEALAAVAPGPVAVAAPAPSLAEPALWEALAAAALVVTADPGVLALAAFLERPVLGILPAGADWWWGGRPDRSPWHPTVRLVRASVQGAEGRHAWADVTAAASALLAAGIPPPAGWPPLHPTDADQRLAETLDRLPGVFPRPASAKPVRLTGGSHNTVFRVRDGRTDCVVRVGIFQPSRIESYEDERHNLRVAGALGLGARLLYADPVDGTLVLDYVKGPALAARDLRATAVAEEAALLYRRLHGGPDFRGHYSIVRKLADGRQALVRAAGGLDLAAAPLLAAADEAGVMLAAHRVPDRPTHNDPIGANFLRFGNRLRLIDWQCAGMGDPHWEVAALAVQCRFPEAVRQSYLTAYFGRPDHPALCRIPLYEVICCAYWWVEYARDAQRGDASATETAQGWLRRGMEVIASPTYEAARAASLRFRWPGL